ncbi:hypothetical protein [Aeromonas sanarellii]|uniref:hypothetical protein n=1 Tax=Aeromonas sanarellii TaxID=633415 RepID=UPI0039887BC3
MQLHEPSHQGLADSVSLPPAGQWRLGFEQGRRLEGANHPEPYQMLLAWFQHEILGLLCGLLFFLPLIYFRQLPDSGSCLTASAICTLGGFAATTCNFASARGTSVSPLAGVGRELSRC